MRDDLRSIISDLKTRYRTKHLLFTSLLRTETELLYSMKAGNTDRADILLNESQDTIDTIDAADAGIRTSTDTLIMTAGINETGVDSFLSSLGDSEAGMIIELKSKCRDLVGTIYKKRSEVNELLSREVEKAGRDIESLAISRKLRFYKED